MKRVVSIIAVVFLMMGIMMGCGQNLSNSGTENTQITEQKANEKTETGDKDKGAFPLTVKDAGGYELKIEDKPKKIVSLTLGSDEMLLSLVDKDRIKSMTFYVDDPKVSNVADVAKGVGVRTDSNAEKVIALQPDMVFVDTWAKADFIQQMRDSNISVYVFKTPSNIDEQKKTVMEIAHVVGEDKKGQEIVDWMEKKLEEVEDKLKGLKPEQKLTVVDYSEMGTTSGKGTNLDDIVTRAGLVNLASKNGLEGWSQISKEMIVQYNPDIICIPEWYYDAKNSFESLSGSIKNDKALAGVKAVKNGKLIALPYSHISSISQYVVLGVEDAAKAAYPELFK